MFPSFKANLNKLCFQKKKKKVLKTVLLIINSWNWLEIFSPPQGNVQILSNTYNIVGNIS